MTDPELRSGNLWIIHELRKTVDYALLAARAVVCASTAYGGASQQQGLQPRLLVVDKLYKGDQDGVD